MRDDVPKDLFPSFEALWIDGPGGRWFARAAGPKDAPPLLLLHGFPQSHAMWHHLAPTLAERARVICLDLKGYGWTAAPRGEPNHATYSKRVLGREIVALMERIGYARFSVAGHDRGARVGYRLALDAPERIERLALLDIVPTCIQWDRIAAGLNVAPHWPFLAKPAPEPEREIAPNPDAYFEGLMRDWTGAKDLAAFDAAALALYRQSWNVPERIHAMCEDYRAGGAEGPDRAADLADLSARRTLSVPTLVLASRDYLDKDKPEPALDAWRRTFAPKAQGVEIDSGHFMAEENPEATLAALRDFLGN